MNSPRLTSLSWSRTVAAAVLFFFAVALNAAEASRITFDLPAGDAAQTLRQFAQQAKREILFPVQPVGGVKTNAIAGEFTVREALDQLLAGTELQAVEDEKTGAIVVKRTPPPAPKPREAESPAPAAVAAAAPTAPATKRNPDDVVTLSQFTVTGSRLTRVEEEGPQPTASYSGSDVQSRGFLSTGDFLQSLSFNSGTTNSIGVPAANPVSNVPFARGAVTLNLRGLGANRFLVLIDGKRPSAYGLADNRGGSVFDFNSIPTEAIERVEYLKDGASAIYGSDAIAGVLNLRLKQSFNGMMGSVMVGNTLGHDTLTRSASLLTGGKFERGSYLFNFNWFAQNGNFARDYDRSQSTDYTAFGAPRGQNNNSTSNWPFNVTLTAAQATAAGFTSGAGFYGVTGGQPVASPTTGSFGRIGASQSDAAIPNANRYDFAPLTQLAPDQENYSAMLNVRRELTPVIHGTAQLLANQNRTGIVYTPISINSRSIVTSDGAFLTIPVANPFNPFGVALDNFRGRGNFGPTRTFDVESRGGTLLLGLEGSLPGGWTWTANATLSESTVDQLAGNQIRNDDMQRALNGTLPGFAGKFFNPFGPTDPALLKALYVTSVSNSKSSTAGGELSVAGRLFDMPALFGGESPGAVGLAAGVEWRKDRLDNHSDPVGYLVTVGDLPYSGSREVTSLYSELEVPVAKKYLTLQLAARYDDYDSFGSTVNPKFALVSQPTKFLKLRASYSRSFKAPEIGQLYQPTITTFTTAIADPLNPGLGNNTYPFVASGNRALKPETGRTWYGGVVLDLDGVVKGLSLSADYFDIAIDDVITTFTSPTVFFNQFPHLVVRNSAGVIQYFDAKTINAAGYRWKGADFGLDYKLRRTCVGDFAVNLQATYTDTIAQNAGSGLGFVNLAGRYNNPRFAGSGQVSWKRGGWAATVGAVHKGSYLMDQFQPAWQEGAETLYNGTLSFDLPWRTRVTLGCNNLLDAQPPQNGKAIPSYGFDIATYAAWSMGRFVYVKIKTEF